MNIFKFQHEIRHGIENLNIFSIKLQCTRTLKKVIKLYNKKKKRFLNEYGTSKTREVI